MFTLPTTVSAQCVQIDVGVQANISGSRTPARQNSQVDMSADGPCSGASTHTRGVQVNTGGRDPVVQNRQVTHTMTPGQGNVTGVNVPVVPVRANAQIDVYNAAD
ncbi:MAG: hypothetical protein AB8B99_14115 [Phormidesmis sp.]